MEELFWRIYDDMFYCSIDLKKDTFYLQLELFMKYKEVMSLLEKFEGFSKKLNVRRRQLRTLRKPFKLHFKSWKSVNHNYQKRRHCTYLRSLRSKHIDEFVTLVCECSELKYEIDLLLDCLLSLMSGASQEPVLFVNNNDDYIIILAMRYICGFDGYIWVNPDKKRLVRCVQKNGFKMAGDEKCWKRINDEKLGLPLYKKEDLLYLELEMIMILERDIMPIIGECTKIERMLQPTLRQATACGFRLYKRAKLHILNKDSCHLKHSKYTKIWWTYGYSEVRAANLLYGHQELMTKLSSKFENLFKLMINASKHPLVFVRDKFEYFLVCCMKEVCGFEGHVWIDPNLEDIIESSRKAGWKLIEDEEPSTIWLHTERRESTARRGVLFSYIGDK